MKKNIYDSKGKYWKTLNLTPKEERQLRSRFPKLSIRKPNKQSKKYKGK